MAGFAERRGSGHGQDSFWTWREAMYAFAERMTPDLLHAVAAQLYVEMLEAGYTWVCEFHYLHHRADGRPYEDPAAMSQALVAAAADTGIGMTLLPVLYMTGGFDRRPLAPRRAASAMTWMPTCACCRVCAAWNRAPADRHRPAQPAGGAT